MKQPHDINVVSAIPVFGEQEMRVSIEERIVVETLDEVLMNFEAHFSSDYVETINVLQGMGAYSYTQKKLDLDLRNRPSPTPKSSTEEPPIPEVKQMPSHLIYVFLGTNNTLPVILAANLNNE